ncbi:hypothetical protein HAX54_051131 [Datura stramonium]|uniref:JmjC domain-containing protein n=1 Tax=Datura stramonium TaxID=4076 RepID=A0ABS8WM10_DATST|nr:hypothetical protein [Datura stramonium]
MEQMIEKQIEYQIQAFPDSEVNIHKAEYEKDECIYCNYCSAFIVDFHRSCSSCSYELCLTCCKELRNGNLQADASEVTVQYIDNGPGYLHGNSITSSKNREGYLHGNSITSSKNGNCAGTTEFKIRDQTEVAMASKWKPKENGAIPCPPKDMGGCSKGTLNLRSAVDTRRANLRHFQLYLSEGEPVVATNVHDNALRSSWEPMVVWRACRKTETDTDVLNCLNWCKFEMKMHQLFNGYMEGRVDRYGWPQLLKLNDWPPSGLFDVRLPRHGAEFTSCLPFLEYTHPQYGYLNPALRLPDSCSKPDLGPKAYIAYGFPMELGRGDSVTKLGYAVTDTVNVLMHTQAVVPTVEQLSAIENLKQIHKAQDQREFVADANRMHESINDCILNVNGKSFLKGLNCDGLKVENSSKAENKKYSQQSEYLKKHFREFRHIHGSPLPQVVHPIFDETFYLSTEHKRRLKEEYGIEPWTFVQKLGEAVFVPAGCPHQVRNLKDYPHKSDQKKYTSGLPSNSTSSTPILAKLIFDCSIKLPLEALANYPMHEKEMCGAIAALIENASSLFSEEQAKQLVKLKYEFPVMVKKWRNLAHDQSSYQEFLTNFDEDRKKLDNWIRSETRLKSEYVKREEQARELEEILQAIKTRQKEIMDERRDASQLAQKLDNWIKPEARLKLEYAKSRVGRNPSRYKV